MKRLIPVLLILCLLIAMAGCAAAPKNTPVHEQKQEAPAETPPAEEPSAEEPPAEEPPAEEPPAEEPPAEEPPAEIPPSETPPVETPSEPLYTGWNMGIWASEPEISDMPGIGNHIYYVCLFENGQAVRFGYRLLELGSWTADDTGTVTAAYTDTLYDQPGSGWTPTGAPSQAVYRYNPESNTLLQLSTEPEYDFSAFDAYYPAARPDTFAEVQLKIEQYLAYGMDNWLTQMDMNFGSGTAAAAYEGLERMVYSFAVTQIPAPQLLEKEWLTTRNEALEAEKAAYAGGSAAALMINTKNCAVTGERVTALLSQLETAMPADPTTANLTQGYWYLFSSQTSDCTEYVFSSDGTVTIRERQVMNGTGAYDDETQGVPASVYPYFVDEATGAITVRGSAWLPTKSGYLAHCSTETVPSVSISVLRLVHYENLPTVEELEAGSDMFRDFYYSNILIPEG